VTTPKTATTLSNDNKMDSVFFHIRLPFFSLFYKKHLKSYILIILNINFPHISHLADILHFFKNFFQPVFCVQNDCAGKGNLP
jgi:hypothetical protein